MREFDSFGAFGRHMMRLAAVGEDVAEHATDDAARIVRRIAKGKLGHYQSASGEYPAWAPLKPETQAERKRQGYTPNDPLLRSGELRRSIDYYRQGTSATVGSDEMVAVWMEAGTETVPPRPFLGPAGFESKAEIAYATAATLAAWVSGLPWRRPQPLTLPQIESAISEPQNAAK